MTCPWCEFRHHIVSEKPTFLLLQQPSKYIKETSPIYKCKQCRMLFSLNEAVG